jgi:hypothetical protein
LAVAIGANEKSFNPALATRPIHSANLNPHLAALFPVVCSVVAHFFQFGAQFFRLLAQFLRFTLPSAQLLFNFANLDFTGTPVFFTLTALVIALAFDSLSFLAFTPLAGIGIVTLSVVALLFRFVRGILGRNRIGGHHRKARYTGIRQMTKPIPSQHVPPQLQTGESENATYKYNK